MCNVFTEKINKIASTLNDDKRIQSIDSIETCAYGTGKDLVTEKEEIDLIKRYKKWLTLVMLQNIIQTDLQIPNSSSSIQNINNRRL